MDSFDPKRRFVENLMTDIAAGHGDELKRRYSAKAMQETPEQRAARKRAEYEEETGDESGDIPPGLNGTMTRLEQEEAARTRAEAAAPKQEESVLEQLRKLMGL